MLVMIEHFTAAIGNETFQWEIGTDPASEKPTTRQSGDGRWVWSSGYTDGLRRIMIRPTSGDNDDVKQLVQTRMRPSATVWFNAIRFTPDSKWVVYHDKDADGKDGLYRVSVSGGPPERLGDYPSSEPNSLLFISPDGRQFLAGDLTPPKPPAFWVLENVIPAAAASAKPAAKVPAK